MFLFCIPRAAAARTLRQRRRVRSRDVRSKQPPDDPVTLGMAAGALTNFGDDVDFVKGLVGNALRRNPGSAFACACADFPSPGNGRTPNHRSFSLVVIRSAGSSLPESKIKYAGWELT